MARQGSWNPSALHKMLVKHFNQGELRTLCFDLGFDYDDLPDEGRINKARELVKYLDRRSQIGQLVNLCQEKRSLVPWARCWQEHVDLYGDKASTRLAVIPEGRLADSSIAPSVGIIAPFFEEYAAAKVLIEDGKDYSVDSEHADEFYWGKIPGAHGGSHSVILSRMPNTGSYEAAASAARLLQIFPTVSMCIVAGLAGGIPCPSDPDRHIRLGDIVVSSKEGVVKYFFDDKDVSKIVPSYPGYRPSYRLLEAAQSLQVTLKAKEAWWLRLIERAFAPFEVDIIGPFDRDLAGSITPRAVPPRVIETPSVFIGPIAAANALQSDESRRDELSRRFDVRAIEMDGSRLGDATRIHGAEYLVVVGICNYCDLGQNDGWRRYAAAVAAAFTRALLESVPSQAAYTRTLPQLVPGRVGYARPRSPPAPDQAILNAELIVAETTIRQHAQVVRENAIDLEFFKGVHDLLQRLSSDCEIIDSGLYELEDANWDQIEQQVPGLRATINDLRRHCCAQQGNAKRLSKLGHGASSVENTTGRLLFSSGMWLDRLEWALRKIQEAIKRTEPIMVKTAVDEIKEVLRRIPNESNINLVNAARVLISPLSSLVPSVVVVRDYLDSSDQEHVVDRDFSIDANDLKNIPKRLDNLVYEHKDWQIVENTMSEIDEKDIPKNANDLRRTFFALMSKTNALCSHSTAIWATGLRDATFELENCLNSGVSSEEITMAYKSYRGKAGIRFNQVDEDLKNLCTEKLLPFCLEDLPRIIHQLDRLRGLSNG